MGGTTVASEVMIPLEGLQLAGTITIPPGCAGIVVFAHGSGSSRFSPRNMSVAGSLVGRGCATLLFDLLTDAEGEDRRNVFDIEMLGRRVAQATRWVTSLGSLAARPVGYFGASTGAAAALVAAAESGDGVSAVVSRGGRPDLAGAALGRVTAPTLLIVGSRDTAVLDLNRHAQEQLRCPSRLEIVEGATHLFEEPGTLERAAAEAGDWFVEQFAGN